MTARPVVRALAMQRGIEVAPPRGCPRRADPYAPTVWIEWHNHGVWYARSIYTNSGDAHQVLAVRVDPIQAVHVAYSKLVERRERIKANAKDRAWCVSRSPRLDRPIYKTFRPRWYPLDDDVIYDWQPGDTRRKRTP